MEYALLEFSLNELQGDNKPLREHLNNIWRQTGRKPPKLEDSPLPPLAKHVWEYFVDLHNERMSINPKSMITSTHMRDWCWLNEVELELWERLAIKKLDAAWLKQNK